MKTTEKISLIIVLNLLFFSSAFALGETSDLVNQNDSIHKYNALENKVNISNTLNGTTSDVAEKLSPDKSEPAVEDVDKTLQDITKKQDVSTLEINKAIDTIKNANGFKSFLVGNGLGTLKFQMVQIEDQVYLLQALFLKTENSATKIQISEQIKFLETEQKTVEDFLIQQNNRFNLLGWFLDIL